MKIGIYSGSFNPVHIGHLIIANYMVEYTDLDEVWFVVSPQNPFKKGLQLLDENQRLRMVELALEGYDKMKASDIEFSLSKPSYTHKTLVALAEKYPQNEFSLIIGADNWVSFDKWDNFEQILTDFKVVVYPRLDFDTRANVMGANPMVVNSPIIEIAATTIRKGLKEGKNVRPFLPEKVYDFILNNECYK